MPKYFFYLPLVLLFASASGAQRHGRADSVQNYARGMSEPELVLDVNTTHQKFRFHASDLRTMKRSAIGISDPHTNEMKTYEGVSLGDLLASTSEPQQFEALELSFGFFHKRTFRNSESDLQSGLVADTVNGKRAKGGIPFFFVTKSRQDGTLVIRKLTCIKFKGTQ